jgi:predicted RNA-binding Zn-ribbon protein involved in translation (DUF1610 family)
MPRATCRCGQVLSFPANGPDRVVCPVCGSRIRVRMSATETGAEDAYIRFLCPCGRRLKVRDTVPKPQAGKCPDCDRVVPVPEESTAAAPGAPCPETATEEFSANDLAVIERWASGHLRKAEPAAPVAAAVAPPVSTASHSGPIPVRAEAGLRVCPRCGRPLHLSAETCRECGASVPKR